MKKKKIDNSAPAGIVTIQDRKIRPTTRKSMAEKPRAMPTPSTAPTNAWVVETGMPVPEANTIVNEAATPAEKPRVGVNGVMRLPTIAMTLHGGVLGDRAGMRDTDDRRDGSNGVGNVIRTMRERHPTRGYDHKDCEHSFDRVEVKFLIGLFIDFDSHNEPFADQRDNDTASRRDRVAFRRNQCLPDIDVFQPFEHGDEGDQKHRHKDIDRRVSAGALKRILARQDQPRN